MISIIMISIRRKMMPFKSEQQRKFFHSKGAAKAGITKKEVKEWDAASKGSHPPKKVKKKK